jgi:hypothetical protein
VNLITPHPQLAIQQMKIAVLEIVGERYEQFHSESDGMTAKNILFSFGHV